MVRDCFRNTKHCEYVYYMHLNIKTSISWKYKTPWIKTWRRNHKIKTPRIKDVLQYKLISDEPIIIWYKFQECICTPGNTCATPVKLLSKPWERWSATQSVSMRDGNRPTRKSSSARCARSGSRRNTTWTDTCWYILGRNLTSVETVGGASTTSPTLCLIYRYCKTLKCVFKQAYDFAKFVMLYFRNYQFIVLQCLPKKYLRGLFLRLHGFTDLCISKGPRKCFTVILRFHAMNF